MVGGSYIGANIDALDLKGRLGADRVLDQAESRSSTLRR